SILELGPNKYEVHLVSQPIKGAANKELIKILAKHFNVSKSKVTIIKGIKSKDKLVKIIFPK
ncbi:MAG: DUF167 domain-containing protein, partial [Candidatus Helarchaeota archaeon]